MPGFVEDQKRVLGLRLSYLSRHQDVRQSILTRVRDDGQDPRAVAQSIVVDVAGEELHFDVLGDEKAAFVANLNKLLPGPPPQGDAYAAEIGDGDHAGKRQHDWGVWNEILTNNADLETQLRNAVVEVLTHGQPVNVHGEASTEMSVDARNSGDPQLVFEVAPEYIEQG